jgi:hypothetical protein
MSVQALLSGCRRDNAQALLMVEHGVSDLGGVAETDPARADPRS